MGVAWERHGNDARHRRQDGRGTGRTRTDASDGRLQTAWATGLATDGPTPRGETAVTPHDWTRAAWTDASARSGGDALAALQRRITGRDRRPLRHDPHAVGHAHHQPVLRRKRR